MDIDAKIAAGLGFPKLKYAAPERERRWLCRGVPEGFADERYDIQDLYVDGARLRLRAERALDGSEPLFRITRKGDVDPRTRLITTIYLSEAEHALLTGSLTGLSLHKIRHRRHTPGLDVGIDQFLGPLEGLVLAEAEFDTDAALAAFPTPDFAVREVTEDPRYTGFRLARDGRPPED